MTTSAIKRDIELSRMAWLSMDRMLRQAVAKERIVLDKDICVQCIDENRRRWGWGKKDVPDPWNANDEAHWKEGWFRCPVDNDRATKDAPSSQCKYRVEQLLKTQGKGYIEPLI